VQVFSADNRLLAFFPASIGSAEKPAPSGTLVVRRVDYDPTYTYDPAYHFKEQKIQRKATVRPGPNNPVGVVWIALSEKGYGIHGTPDPDAVGKTQSHGCIRLTNWDALTLARLVKKGTPVDFIG
jgi:lipoprotein-anchoring transpeptidase ErfK/SrfK